VPRIAPLQVVPCFAAWQGDLKKWKAEKTREFRDGQELTARRERQGRCKLWYA
jgi:hypothetical protein